MERRRKTQRTRHPSAPKVLRAAHLAVVFVLTVATDVYADEAAVRIAGRYDKRVAHVEIIGKLYNGNQDVGHGSGFLVGNNLIVTNSHVVPPENNYKQLDIFIRLRSRLINPIAATLLERDPAKDLALLKLAGPTVAGTAGCPVPVTTNEVQAPMGTSVYVLGFPLDQDLSLSGGLISNHGNPPAEMRWQTDTVMNLGNSGGPAFAENGSLLGFAVGGIVQWRLEDGIHNVNGVNFLIPAAQLVASPLYKYIEQLPDTERCWNEQKFLAEASNATTMPAKVLPPANATTFQIDSARIRGVGVDIENRREPLDIPNPAPIGPPTINRSYTAAQTKDDHPVILDSHSKRYEISYRAEPGYRIVGCTFRAESANHASDVACNVDPSSSSATFSFRLTSGPAVDRWRGWWAGHVTLAQERM